MAGNGPDAIRGLIERAGEAIREAAGAEAPREPSVGDKIVDFLALIHERPVPQQIGIGGGAGLVTGYLFTRGSKATAAVLGVTLLTFQFASYKGYVQVNHASIKNDIRQFAQGIERQIGGRRSLRINKDLLADYVMDNIYLIGGFSAGWLIGFSLA